MTHPTGKPAFLRKTAIASALAALAAPALAQDLMLEEVVVTAQKRSESVQDISATVNVVTGESVDDFAAFSFGELEQQTAGMTLSTPNARNSSISMRGIGTDPEAGTAAAVDVYWNDQAIRPDIAFTQLYDLARLEILRGPQGTLQGRTSPAGAINIVTKRPDLFEAEGYVQGSFSDDDGINGQAAWGGPLIEGKLGLRVSGVYDTNNANNVENINPESRVGDDPEAEAKSARISGVWQVTDTFSADLIYQWLDREVDDNKAVSGNDPQGIRPRLRTKDQKALGKYDNFGELEYDVASLILSWELGNHELTGVYGYTSSEKGAGTENDRAAYVADPNSDVYPELLTHQNSFTEVDADTYELRLNSISNEFWDYMVGVYYQDQQTSTAFKANTTTSGISFYTQGAIPVDSKELGLFTFNTFYLSDMWQLEFGLRWTDYERFRRADVFFGDLNYLPPALEPIEDLVRAGFEANFPINAVSPENQKTEEDAVTGSLKLRWDAWDHTSLYASYNRGYRPSGISIVPDPDVQFLPNGEDDLLHDEEKSDSIELGFKSRLGGGRATLNGAVYYQQFDGYLGFVRGIQVLNDDGEPVDISGGLIFNGDAFIYGAELEGQMLLTESWTFGGALSYAKGEWDDGAEAPCNDRDPGEVLGSCDIEGEALGGEPEWSASLHSEVWFPLSSTEIYLRGLYKYTGDRANTDASAGNGVVRDEFDPHHNLNLHLGWRASDFKWDVNLWVKNALDQDEVIFQTGSDQYDIAATGGSYTQENILKERTIGLTARYNF